MNSAKAADWNNRDAVAKAVDREISKIEQENEREFYCQPWETVPDVPASNVYEQMEQQAVKEANRGRFESLAELLRPEHPFNQFPLIPTNPIRSHLLSSTWSLIADIMTRKHKVSVGRPKQSDDERRQEYPVHDAAKEVLTIESILSHLFPDRSARDVHDRALEIAEGRHPVGAGTIANHLKRPKSRKLK